MAGRLSGVRQGAVVEAKAVLVESAESKRDESKDHAPVDESEEYDHAVENVSWAFMEFLHVAL